MTEHFAEKDAPACPTCGHPAHMTGWCEHDAHPACDCPTDSVIPPGTSDLDLDQYLDQYDAQPGIETTVIPPDATKAEA